MIAVDQLHDVHTEPKIEKRYEYGRIVQGAKTLAKKLNCPVLLVAQLNRGLIDPDLANKHPTLTSLRESGTID